MKNYLRRKLINVLVRHLFDFVSEEDFLQTVNGKLMVGTDEVVGKRKDEIRTGASVVITTEAYRLVTNELRVMAKEKICERSTSIDDIMFGKAMLYVIDLLHTKLFKLSKM